MVTVIKSQENIQQSVLSDQYKNGLETPKTSTSDFKAFGEDGLTFLDLLDIINPFQHIPVLSSFYRQMTGDTIDPAPRIAGGTLFFGPIGAAAAVINSIVEYETGSDLGEHAMALFKDNNNVKDASNETPKEQPVSSANSNSKSISDTDPVTAWAMQELAWAKKKATLSDAYSAAKTNLASADLPDTTLIIKDTGAPRDHSNSGAIERTRILPLTAVPGIEKYESAKVIRQQTHILDIVN